MRNGKSDLCCTLYFYHIYVSACGRVKSKRSVISSMFSEATRAISATSENTSDINHLFYEESWNYMSMT